MNFFAKVFRNKFFIIVVCAAILISIIPAVLTAMGQGHYVKSAVQTIAYPFQWAFSKVGEGLGGYSEYFKTMNDLREENASLKQQLAEMEEAIYEADLLQDENDFLRNYLGTKAEHVDFEFTDAIVIGYESTNYSTSYTLSKGSLAGIEKNMPVINEEGLVGYISEVGSTWSRVCAITETGTAVGVYIERSGVSGVLQGSLSLRLDGLCKMVYIEADADIRVGDSLITSGIGSFYPRGIEVGKVVEITTDAGTRTLVAKIKPAANPEGARKLMIVTSFDRISGEDEQ